MKNMVAIGATSAVLNLDINVFQKCSSRNFWTKRDNKLLQKNMEAIKAGYDYLKESNQ